MSVDEKVNRLISNLKRLDQLGNIPHHVNEVVLLIEREITIASEIDSDYLLLNDLRQTKNKQLKLFLEAPKKEEAQRFKELINNLKLDFQMELGRIDINLN